MNKKLEIKGDERGKLIEVFKISEFGQVNYITAKPKVIRGNHYHNRKQEKFFIIEGKAKITLKNRNTNEIKEFIVSGENPEIIDITPDWIHSIENIGEGELKFLAWVNEIFDDQDPDTFSEEIK